MLHINLYAYSLLSPHSTQSHYANVEDKPNIAQLYETLEYGPAPESPSVAAAWLDDHGRNLGHFINGQWVKPEGRQKYDTHNPATGEKLATTVQGKCINESHDGCSGWSQGCIVRVGTICTK